MSNKIDIKTLEALRQDSHEAFEEVFITYYGKTKPLSRAISSRVRMLKN